MPVHWLIEVDVFAETASRFCAALDELQHPWTRYHDDVRSAELPPPEVSVIFWGLSEPRTPTEWLTGGHQAPLAM